MLTAAQCDPFGALTSKFVFKFGFFFSARMQLCKNINTKFNELMLWVAGLNPLTNRSLRCM